MNAFILYFGLLATYRIVEDCIIHLLLKLSYIIIFICPFKSLHDRISHSYNSVNQSIRKDIVTKSVAENLILIRLLTASKLKLPK